MSKVLLNGAEAITELLAVHGIKTVFAYPGTSELPLCRQISSTPEIEIINSRGDKEAAFMAAGGNLVQPSSCAAVLHGARGLTNALGATGDVRRSETSVLYLVGMASRASAPYLPPHAEPNLLNAAGEFAKSTHDLSTLVGFDSATFMKICTEAFTDIGTFPSGPVLLGVPQDLLTSRFIPHDSVCTSYVDIGRDSEQSLEPALKLVSEARNPLILIDDYALRRGEEADNAIVALAETLKAPVFQVAYNRGPMLFQELREDASPMVYGNYNPLDERHAEIFNDADLLITLEDRNMYPRVIGPLPDCSKLAFTSNLTATLKNDYLGQEDFSVVGDPISRITSLTRLLRKSASESSRSTKPSPSEHKPRTPRDCHQNAISLAQGVALGLNNVSDPIIVDDSQMFGGLISKTYSLLPSGTRIFGSHGGFVGGGLATAAGLAISHTDRNVVCFLGDQGYTNGVQALSAIGETQAPLLMIICNNGASVSLRKQARYDDEETSSRIDSVLGNNQRMDYVAVAQGYGISGIQFEWPSISLPKSNAKDLIQELSHLISSSLLSRSPHVIELKTPSDFDFWSGVWNTSGFETALRT